jgi:imidazolonepropionase-like amidohydrolase
LKQFIESNAVMGMGTDSGTPMNFHTEALWREAQAHVDMGMSPQRVISALTRVGAGILGKTRDLGTIETGKLADIIVVNGNPLFNINALAHVEVVVKGGVIYKGGPPVAARSANAAPAAAQRPRQ